MGKVDTNPTSQKEIKAHVFLSTSLNRAVERMHSLFTGAVRETEHALWSSWTSHISPHPATQSIAGSSGV